MGITEKISQRIVGFIYKNTDADKDMTDVYQYGVEITISSAVNFALIMLCSIIFKDFWAGAVFLCCFIPLRSYTGGYHARTYLRCNGAFAVTYGAVFALGKLTYHIRPSIFAAAAFLAAAFLPVLKFAPVENKYKKLTEEKKKRSRVLSIVIYIIISAAALALYSLDIWYGCLTAAAAAAVSALILIELALRKMNIHKDE